MWSPIAQESNVDNINQQIGQNLREEWVDLLYLIQEL